MVLSDIDFNRLKVMLICMDALSVKNNNDYSRYEINIFLLFN